MVKVLVVIPYEETRIHFEKVIKRYQGKGVSFTITSLFGTDYRRLQMVKNYDIVVVRGMTRSAISSFFPEIPIVPIAINVSDLLEALLEVKNLYGSHSKVGVLYSDAFMCSETTISSLISMEINMRTISNEVEMIERINELKNKGCNVFVGGLTLQRYCSSRKMPVVSLKTGVETIEKSIQEAFNSAFIIRKERLHVDLLKSISDNLMEPLIVSNGKNEVVAYNIQEK